MKIFAVVLPRQLALALPLAAALLGCGPTVSTGGACSYNGQSYDVGDSFPADDGCNSCTCMEDGSFACTAIGCPEGCEYNGQIYQPGDAFPAGDGCNSCSCGDDGSVACTKLACPQGQCSHEGYFHAPGTSWQSFDQCDSCTCEAGGMAICSDNGACTTCYYAGALHQSGDTFPSIDGCNNCTCDDGGIACTEIACPCDPAKEWWRSYIGGPGDCAVIDFDCAAPTNAFENECGCGCEQPAWCPQVFDCQPPTPCNVEEIAQLCPMSQIAL
jgi:von Willebrand factor type C domain